MIRNVPKRAFGLILLVSCLVSFSSCGYFLYPERRGQIQGEIDPPILILDCAALVLFVIPGAIALAVDFTSGAVYLPNKKKRSSIDKFHVDNQRARDASHLGFLISNHTGEHVLLDAESVIRVPLETASEAEVEEVLNYLNSNIHDKTVLKQFSDHAKTL